MISFDEAVRLVVETALPMGTEAIPLDEAHGRILAGALSARSDAPPTRVSAMDGYAVRRADLDSLPARLRLIGRSYPGDAFVGDVLAGEAVRIFTGAAVPSGADWIVMQENVDLSGDMVVVRTTDSGASIRAAGSDFQRGEMLLEPGTPLTPGAIVVAAAADVPHVSVYRRPRLRLIATGDELAEPGKAYLQPGAIPESVSFGVAALARTWGGEPIGRVRLRDELATMIPAASEALQGADLVVVTGGASVGERDFAKAMLGDPLELIFDKVAMKPGKPVWLGRCGDTLVMGLPGNPTSALVTARLLLAPLICGLVGRDPHAALRWRSAPLSEAIGPVGDRETFSRAQWHRDRVSLLPNQDSGAQRMLALTELLVRRPAGATGFTAGEAVEVLDF